MMDLDFLQGGRTTRRYHGLPMLDHQRVDAHSYGVAMLVRYLIGSAAPVERQLRLINAALEHDLAEHRSGDIPAPTKRIIPGLREACGAYEGRLMGEAGFIAELELTDADMRVLKLADAAEGCLHCIEERRMGNAHPRLINTFYTFWAYCTEEQNMGGPNEGEHEKHLRRWMAHAWEKANGGKW